MCFAPQRRALFWDLNFEKWSEAGVFCTFWLQNDFFDISTSTSGPKPVCLCVFFTFWLQNVLRARTVCTFSTSQLPKVVRTWCVLYIFTSKCASRWPAGSAPAALASLLFDPPEPQIIGKTQCFAVSRLSYLFAHSASAFFWLFLFSDLLSSTLSLLSASSLLCFSSIHIVGSLTSKLPSITKIHVSAS